MKRLSNRLPAWPPPYKFDLAHARLVQIRAKVMDRDIALGEILCQFTFAEGLRVVTLARDRAHIVYNRTYVAKASAEELTMALEGIARRAPAEE